MAGPPNLDAGFNSLDGEYCAGDCPNASPAEHTAFRGHPHEGTNEDPNE